MATGDANQLLADAQRRRQLEQLNLKDKLDRFGLNPGQFAFARYNTGITKLYSPLKRPKTLREYVKQQRNISGLVGRDAALRQFATRYSGVASPDMMKAIGQGFQTATQIADMAKVAGPKGVAIGAAVGMVGGFVAGIIPTERNEAEAKWDSIVSAMSPMDRYLVLATIQPLATDNARKEGKVFEGGTIMDPTGPWRWADDPELGHSPWGGPIGRTVNFVERLFRMPLVGNEVANDSETQKDQLGLYLVLFMAGAHDNRRKVSDMRYFWPIIESGRAAPPLVEYMKKYKEVDLLTLRQLAVLRGINNIWNPLLTPSMRVQLER
jgi:hypothetical protein